jgi:phosphatidylethanolamine-binding protein (PEBP) family uncharacterized protein
MNKPILLGITFLLVAWMSGCVQPTSRISMPTSMTAPVTTVTTSAAGAPGTVESSTTRSVTTSSRFVLRSPEVVEGGILPRDYTCDGTSATLPLEWSGAPVNTNSFAVVMYTIPSPTETHWYWVVYNIPSSVQSLARNVTGVGTLGNNSVNGRIEYAPPCSKGPGAKLYTYTIYALSAPPEFTVPPAKISRDVLLSAIADRTLARPDLNVYYSR